MLTKSSSVGDFAELDMNFGKLERRALQSMPKLPIINLNEVIDALKLEKRAPRQPEPKDIMAFDSIHDLTTASVVILDYEKNVKKYHGENSNKKIHGRGMPGRKLTNHRRGESNKLNVSLPSLSHLKVSSDKKGTWEHNLRSSQEPVLP